MHSTFVLRLVWRSHRYLTASGLLALCALAPAQAQTADTSRVVRV